MARTKKIKKLTLLLIAAAMVIFLCGGILVCNGKLPINNPSQSAYPVRGVDVSSYQGTIDWSVLADQDISFAFIKATEGSSLVDKRFAYNWENANKIGLRVGAYHFFSFDSAGSTQAQNYIDTVPRTKNMLPPVIDVEFYGDYIHNPASKEKTRAILDEFIAIVEDYYGLNPIIYVNSETYNRYLIGGYEKNDIWIRNIHFSPYLSDGRNWTFWQYSNKGKLAGYSGEEEYIDLNVFNGSKKAFEEYATS